MSEPQPPRVVCLCGSARFAAAKAAVAEAERAAGRVVLTTPDMQAELDAMRPRRRAAALAGLGTAHRLLIEAADEVLVVNPGGYVGPHTAGEISYARQHGKPVRLTEPERELEAG
jgi:predicted phosphodiesterase